MKRTLETQSIEIGLLLEGLFRISGHDFRNDDRLYLRRKIGSRLRAERLATVSGLQDRMFRDSSCVERILSNLASDGIPHRNRTSDLYRVFREKAMPFLRTYPSLRVWCANGIRPVEIYVMAALLEEAGLYGRCKIYVTDMTEPVLRNAQQGVFGISDLAAWARFFRRAGGRKPLSHYCATGRLTATFRPALRKNIFFAQHNLATDGSFNEFQAIFTRDATSRCEESVRRNAHALFHESLCAWGFLGLGDAESIAASPARACYQRLDAAAPLYRRIR